MDLNSFSRRYHGTDDGETYDMPYYAAGPSGSSSGGFDERDLIDEMIEEIGASS